MAPGAVILKDESTNTTPSTRVAPGTNNLVTKADRIGAWLAMTNSEPAPTQAMTGKKRITMPRAVLGLLGIHKGAGSVPLEEYGREIARCFIRNTAGLRGNTILSIEPGRAVVSTGGIFVAPVVAVKDDWIFLDASTNYLPESFFFAQRLFLPAVSGDRKMPVRRYNIAGSSLNSSDVLGLGIPLPVPQEGDLFVLLDAGAYTVSRANRFTTLCPPVYLLAPDGMHRLIRRQEETSDVTAPMLE